MKKLSILAMLLFMTIMSFSTTYHSGTISRSQTWYQADGPHIINGQLTITGSGVVVTVEEASVVKMAEDVIISSTGKLKIEKGVTWKIIPQWVNGTVETYYIDVQGEMDVSGDIDDAYVYFYTSGSYASTGWKGIYFATSADNCNLKACDIKDGKKTKQTSYSHGFTHSGGAICIESSSTQDIEISYCKIHDNEASSGAGIYVKEARSGIKIHHNIIYNNLATDGGGIYFNSNNSTYPPTLTNNLIYDNEVTNDGGGICSNNIHLKLDFNTIADNIAIGSGGGLCLSAYPVGYTYNNNIIYSNLGTGGSEQTYPLIHDDIYDHCCVEGIVGDTNDNTSGDPEFYSTGGNDYHINDQSDECYGKGTNLYPIHSYDIDGNSRSIDSCEIGADEYDPNIGWKQATENGNEISIKTSVFPNPVAGNHFCIQYKTDDELISVKVIVFNQLGEICYQTEIESNRINTINCSDWIPGFYFVRFSPLNEIQHIEKMTVF